MPPTPVSHFAFLQLVVALSAYISAVRLTVIGRLGSANPPAKPAHTKWFLLALIPADAPLVLCGLLLAADVFWPDMCNTPTPWRLYYWAVRLFLIAVAVLAGHHLVAWVLAIKKYAPWTT